MWQSTIVMKYSGSIFAKTCSHASENVWTVDEIQESQALDTDIKTWANAQGWKLARSLAKASFVP